MQSVIVEAENQQEAIGRAQNLDFLSREEIDTFDESAFGKRRWKRAWATELHIYEQALKDIRLKKGGGAVLKGP
jgi:hypothetical protein